MQEFQRTLVFDGNKLSLHDDIRSTQPHQYTILLHADQAITQQGSTFVMKDGTASLNVSIADPADPITRVGLNNVIAPGPPGAVDKGLVQARGHKLEISNRAPAKDLQIRVELTPN